MWLAQGKGKERGMRRKEMVPGSHSLGSAVKSCTTVINTMGRYPKITFPAAGRREFRGNRKFRMGGKSGMK